MCWLQIMIYDVGEIPTATFRMSREHFVLAREFTGPSRPLRPFQPLQAALVWRPLFAASCPPLMVKF